MVFQLKEYAYYWQLLAIIGHYVLRRHASQKDLSVRRMCLSKITFFVSDIWVEGALAPDLIVANFATIFLAASVGRRKNCRKICDN